MTGALRVLVLGYVVRGPLGGLAWHHLHYVLGLADLGHDVIFLEDGSGESAPCYDPSSDRQGTDCAYGLRFAAATFSALGLADRWAYLPSVGSAWVGPAAARVSEMCRTADVVINVSGVNAMHDRYDQVGVRILVDTDPAFTQVRVLTEPAYAAHVLRHTSFHTFAANIRRTGHRIPDDGVAWTPTVQPVHLRSWRATPVPSGAALTTVMQWDSYDRRSWGGITYGMKAESFEPYRDLPQRVPVPLELAIGSPTAPKDELAEAGWTVRNPLEVTRATDSYQAYIARSLGEFSVAKHGYVVSRSGWFSERTANYLASGRPAVVQDTGFSEWIECGEGLLAFSTREEAIAAITDVAADPVRHGRRARELAEAHFDAARVLQDLLDKAR